MRAVLYVGKVLRYNQNVPVREKVRFPVVEWNAYESVLRDLATTNNNVEAFHRGMHAIMPQSHPAFYKCLDKLLLLQRKTDNECARADYNQPQSRKRKADAQHRRDTVYNIVTSWKNDFTDEEKINYVRSIAHQFVVPSRKAKRARQTDDAEDAGPTL